MNSNTIASANAALIGSVDWDKVDAQSIIDAMKKGEIRGPLTEWLARKGWSAEMLATPEPHSLSRLVANLESDPDIQAAIKVKEIIHVDRSVKPNYPDWMKEVLHPDLEKTGPTEYNITTIDQWLHDGQEDGKCTTGDVIYADLKDNDEAALKTCLGLRDLEEIQKKGIKFFRKYFKGKAVFGWVGAVRNRYGDPNVPCLCEHGDKVVLNWYWTGNGWRDGSPALRHASNSPQA